MLDSHRAQTLSEETEVSTSLARKIRRIGLVRLAQTKIVTTQDEQGNEVEATHTTYRTYRPFISEAELSAKTEEIVAAWRAKRKKNRRAA